MFFFKSKFFFKDWNFYFLEKFQRTKFKRYKTKSGTKTEIIGIYKDFFHVSQWLF